MFDASGAQCGRCINVYVPPFSGGGGRNVTVMVTSSYNSSAECSGCGENGLILSTQAYREVNNMGPNTYGSMVTVEWEFVPCPGSFVNGSVEYYFNEYTSPGYFGVQPRNTKKHVVKMEVVSNGATYTLTNPQDNKSYIGYMFVYLSYNLPNQPKITAPFTLRSTTEDGQVLEEEFAQFPAPYQTLPGTKQFC